MGECIFNKSDSGNGNVDAIDMTTVSATFSGNTENKIVNENSIHLSGYNDGDAYVTFKLNKKHYQYYYFNLNFSHGLGGSCEWYVNNVSFKQVTNASFNLDYIIDTSKYSNDLIEVKARLTRHGNGNVNTTFKNLIGFDGKQIKKIFELLNATVI